MNFRGSDGQRKAVKCVASVGDRIEKLTEYWFWGDTLQQR
jgi:hypothetical protein